MHNDRMHTVKGQVSNLDYIRKLSLHIPP